MEHQGGSAASLAEAANAFDYFFYHGLGIQTSEDILGISALTHALAVSLVGRVRVEATPPR